MTAVTTMPRATSPASAPFRRRIEAVIIGIGLAGAFVFQGGVALVIARSDDQTLRTEILPALQRAGFPVSEAEAQVALGTLAAWFGYSLIIVALLSAIGLFIASRRPRSRSTGWLFFGAGIACLLGTQLVLYPVAFFFFLSAALFAVRTPPPRSTT